MESLIVDPDVWVATGIGYYSYEDLKLDSKFLFTSPQHQSHSFRLYRVYIH